MKKLLYSILAIGFCAAMNSCWQEDIPEAGAARHQVTELKGVPGDEEALLTWTMPENWEPTDYIITYTTSSEQSFRTGGKKEFTATELTNGSTYVFNVQAVYGKLISNAVSVSVKPSTSRFPVTDLDGDGSDSMVTLYWTRPATTVLSYTLTWFKEGAEADIQTVELDAEKESYEVTGLTNDVNYTFSLVANYTKGASEAATVKVMPTLAIPYILDRTTAAVNQPITFKFNMEGYPTATNIEWTFPDGAVIIGEEVSYGIGSTGTQKVTLSADIKGKTKTWTLEVVIREYVINFFDWEQNGTNYEGFKGGCPVFSPDGKTIYDITFNKKAALYALDVITGELKWKYVPETAMPSYNPITVNPVTGDIYFGTTSAANFFAITSEGELKWQFKGANSMKSAAPAVNAAGTVVYIGDNVGNIFALDAATGTQLWTYATGSATAALLVNGSELVVGAGNGTVVFLNVADGSEVAKLALGANMTDISGFAVAADKATVYAPCKTSMAAFNLNTHTVTIEAKEIAGNNLYEPVVAPNGTIFVGGKDNTMYCLNPDLTVKWSKLHTDAKGNVTNAFNYSRPCVDAENNFYITSGQNGNTTYVLTADGDIRYAWKYDASDNNQKQMGGNNFLDGVLYTAFIGSTTKNGALVGKYFGGQRASGWSTHGGDICGSCCIK